YIILSESRTVMNAHNRRFCGEVLRNKKQPRSCDPTFVECGAINHLKNLHIMADQIGEVVESEEVGIHLQLLIRVGSCGRCRDKTAGFPGRGVCLAIVATAGKEQRQKYKDSRDGLFHVLRSTSFLLGALSTSVFFWYLLLHLAHGVLDSTQQVLKEFRFAEGLVCMTATGIE